MKRKSTSQSAFFNLRVLTGLFVVLTRLFVAIISVALEVVTNAEEARPIKYTAGGSQIIITDLGLLPGGNHGGWPGD